MAALGIAYAPSLEAVSLDGTVAIQYQAASYPFAGGDFARGFVWLNGGFSIPAGGTVAMNVARVAGPVNLNALGTIFLEGDLPLDSNVTLPTGGVIDGQGFAVKLGGNMTIPTGTVLQCITDTVIDGQGHTLSFQDGAPGGQLLIGGPAGTRVTLRNMTIQGVKSYSDGTPSILFGASPDQVLILEDVTFQLSDQFFFSGGKLKIKNFVKLTGVFSAEARPTLAPANFIYVSSNDFIIKRNATFFVDTNVAFIYTPIDASNQHFHLRGPSSRLFLNGCTLFVPQSIGLELTKGQLTVDHKTFLQGDGVTETSKPIQFGNGAQSHDLAIDMLPGGTMEVFDAVLRYQNQN